MFMLLGDKFATSDFLWVVCRIEILFIAYQLLDKTTKCSVAMLQHTAFYFR